MRRRIRTAEYTYLTDLPPQSSCGVSDSTFGQNERKGGTQVRVELREHACQGHGRCHALAPEVYQLNDDGYLDVDGSADIAPADEAAARRGAAACPERALRVLP